MSESDASLTLYKIAARTLRQTFRRHQVYWLGPEARQLWEAGLRLAGGALSPVECDVKDD